MRRDPIDEALAELERGRYERVVVVAVLMVALVATVVIVLLGPGEAPVASFVAAGALAIVVVAHIASLVVRERRSVRAVRALVAARAAHAADEGRERTLGALHAASRSVAASLELADVVERGAVAAAKLVGASTAVLSLSVEAGLAVVASHGPATPTPGLRRWPTPSDQTVLSSGATVVGGGDADDAPRVMRAPLALPDRVIGVLEVCRDPADRAFEEHDRLALALLAEHVALALRNATTHDRERQRAAAFGALVGIAADEPDAELVNRSRG